MPRITSGTAKNRNIKVPNIPDIRVVQDVYKLAVFSIIGEKITGAQCLDLYAGSGSLGLDALSRGAEWCDFVDENKRAVYTIKENLQKTNLKNAEVYQDNAVKYSANTEKTYDIIFVDPFFNDQKHKFLLKNIEEILTDEGIVVFSHGKDLDISDQAKDINLKIYTERRFGQSYLTILTKS